MKDYLYTIRKMLFDGIDENIVVDWAVNQYEKGNVTSRMLELAYGTIADIVNHYL